MTSGSVRVKTRGVVKLRNATARELLNSIIHYHFGQTLNGESLKEIGRPPSFTSAWFSQTMTLKIQMVVNLAPVSLSNKKVNFYTFPRLTFLKTKNATENAYKSIFEPLDFKIFWGSMPPHPLAARAFGARNLPRLVLKSGYGPDWSPNRRSASVRLNLSTFAWSR